MSIKKTAVKKIKITATKSVTPQKSSPIKEAYTKSQIITHISEMTNLGKKDVDLVFEALRNLIGAHINKKGAKQFSFLGLFKITAIKKPATKAKKGRNPFTGEEITVAAKPARNVVKIRALKKLKEMAEK